MTVRVGPALLAFAALVALSARATGQSPPDPLAQPHGMTMCRVMPGLGPGIVLQFLDHPDTAAHQREIKAGFDSAGTPLFIQVWAPEHRPGERDRAYVLMVGFIPGAKALRAVGDEDSLMTETDSTRYPKREVMSDSEVAAARTLAVWLWNRRCMRHGG